MTWQMIIYLSAAAAGASLLGFGGWKVWQQLKAYLARPKKYFLRDLEEAHAKLLSDAGIEFETGQAPDGTHGIIVKYERLPAALAAISASHTASLMLDGTRLHEAVIAFPHENAAAYSPTATGVWFHRRDKKVAARVQKVVHSVLAGRITSNFGVNLDQGQRPSMREDGNFRIYFGSAPKGGEEEMLPVRLFNIEMEPQQAWRYTATGAPVTDPTTGHIVGEFTKGMLFIYADFWQMGEEQRLALLTRTLQRLLVEREPAAFLPEVLAEEGDGIPKAAARQSIADEDFFVAEERSVVRATLHTFLSPFLRQEIHVKNCQGITQVPLNDGMFHVFFNSSPGGRPVEAAPAKLLGCDLIRRDKAFGPSGLGVPLFEKEGFVYAELVGSNLYIHQHLLTHSSKAEAKLLARLFIKVGRLLEKQQARRGGPRYTEEDLQDELALIVSGTTGATKKGEPVSDAELTKALRDSLNADLEVYRLEHSGSEELGREFDELCRVYKVRSVQVKQRTIVIETDTLYCVDPRSGKRHEIGEFKITIPMDNSTQVTWMNQTRTMRIDGRTMHAPHVSAHGHACFGNTQDLFPMLVKKREFASAVQLAIAFIESVNVSDNWGKGISQWPEAVGNVT